MSKNLLDELPDVPMNFLGKTLCGPNLFWLVVSPPLKNISQIGNLPQMEVNIKNV